MLSIEIHSEGLLENRGDLLVSLSRVQTSPLLVAYGLAARVFPSPEDDGGALSAMAENQTTRPAVLLPLASTKTCEIHKNRVKCP